jgi:hypothetical protein
MATITAALWARNEPYANQRLGSGVVFLPKAEMPRDD